ncbi:MAG: DUF1743 domain-containing protein [Halobacteria archaeon]
MIVGLDDTDSRTRGMCTTYLAALIAENVDGTVTERTLVRLNPNVPYKTRGNACLSFHVDSSDPDGVKETVMDLVEEYAVFEDGDTNPAVAFLDQDRAGGKLSRFTRETVRDVKSREEPHEVADVLDIDLRSYGNGRGAIGAVAALGSHGYLERFGDWTYELIAYRDRDRWGESREVDYESFFEASVNTYPDVWDTVDRNSGSVVAVPSTPGPIIYGLRGGFEDVWRANSYVESGVVDHVAVYWTNQGTDSHLVESPEILENWRSYRLVGEVTKPPENREGGHVFFSTEILDTGDTLECAAFEPTKGFRDVVRGLRVGDGIEVCGGLREGTLNLEKIRITDLNNLELRNPVCTDCGNSMESAGRNQGYRCRDCGNKADTKEAVEVERSLDEGWYEVPPSARRHIAKPLVRGGFSDPHLSR